MDERLRLIGRLLEGKKMAPLCREISIFRSPVTSFTSATGPVWAHCRIATASRFGTQSVALRGRPQDSEHQERATTLGSAEGPRQSELTVPRDQAPRRLVPHDAWTIQFEISLA